MSATLDPSTLPAWNALRSAAADGPIDLRQAFATDEDRAARFTLDAVDLRIDFSKNLVTDEILRLLVELAVSADVTERRDAMFRGDHINSTEDRAVLHTALRRPKSEPFEVDGQDVVGDV